METLAARVLGGESLWPFNSRHSKTARELEKLGLINWKSGITEKTIRAWFTPQGKEAALSGTYKLPVVEELEEKIADLEKQISVMGNISVTPPVEQPAKNKKKSKKKAKDKGKPKDKHKDKKKSKKKDSKSKK